MSAPLNLLPSAMAELFAQTSLTGRLTLADRYGLLAALLQDSLADEDRQAIDRLIYGIRHGRVTVVDEISAIAQFE